MSRVVHFEISAGDPEKVSSFYQEVFGWKVEKWEGPQEYWLVTTGDSEQPGIDGAIYTPSSGMEGTVNTIGVDDIDAAVEKVTASGGKLITEKTTIPGVGYQIYCADVEGSVFGLHQTDESAGQ